MNISRRIRTSFAAAALVAGSLTGVVSAAAPASASGASCPSGWIWHGTPQDFYDGSGRLAAIGYVYGYSWGGCAYLVAQGIYSGMYKWMDVQIESDTGQVGYDGGHYYYYAGPVSASSSSVGDQCMTVWYDMQNSAGNRIVQWSGLGTPCD